jgi:hypothetical protein
MPLNTLVGAGLYTARWIIGGERQQWPCPRLVSRLALWRPTSQPGLSAARILNSAL